ncbi:adenylate/guanylate cyclase domain-containing protein [Mesorhizobium xinjiangense]|uniref:adenylate/guanylate cyclase domain-containing protein n=1 Tax=Mesorhizobium xinjiangense TaxID=2678685 RepID=UPI0012ED6FC6|nr:adenylate/guanylate cyclase domain-containing protein [Mesorhizobium xinjiangense]
MDERTDKRREAASRRLTTIFSADVKGYSKLMAADEEGTLATLKEYRDAMARLIAAHDGRVINTWGDGLIAEFASVVNAVRAAIDVQNELGQRNGKRGEANRMHFRIGLNLGDVIVDGDDIYGDGVNIAARLEAEAPPGGILISNTVYDQVRNKLSVGFEFLGNLEVKNIAEAVPSYAVRIGVGSDDAGMAGQRVGRRAPRAKRPTAVARRERSTSARRSRVERMAALLALVGIGLVAINIATWGGTFWAVWPLIVFAMITGVAWARRQDRFDRVIAALSVVGLGVLAINLTVWHGEFWAIWPLIGMSVAAGVRLILRHTR